MKAESYLLVAAHLCDGIPKQEKLVVWLISLCLGLDCHIESIQMFDKSESLAISKFDKKRWGICSVDKKGSGSATTAKDK
jgi:hypothetical protein